MCISTQVNENWLSPNLISSTNTQLKEKKVSNILLCNTYIEGSTIKEIGGSMVYLPIYVIAISACTYVYIYKCILNTCNMSLNECKVIDSSVTYLNYLMSVYCVIPGRDYS